MKNPDPSLFGLTETFFRDHLQGARCVSPNTVRSYRDSLQLFLEFVAKRRKCDIDKLCLADVTSEVVLDFLKHLEADRGNCVLTRNTRFAALRCWVRHLMRHDVEHGNQYNQVLLLPVKRSHPHPPEYLEPEQIHWIYDEINTDDHSGTRDAALLLMLYGTGARVGEVLSVRWKHLRLERPHQVRILGKGGKERVCPLWKQTAVFLRHLEQETSPSLEDYVFLNQHGQPLTRDGVSYLLRRYYQQAQKKHPSLPTTRMHPHMLRHSCAMALMESGVGLTSIRDYLGHRSISTTGLYLQTNLALKDAVLRRFWESSGIKPKRCPRWQSKPGLLDYLESL